MPFINTGDGSGSSGGGGGGGGFAWAPYDWASDSANGFGVGAADFAAPVDLSTLDSGLSLSASSLSTDAKQLRIRPSTGSSLDTSLAGARLFDVADGEEGVWAIRLSVRHTSAAATDAAPTATSTNMHVACALFNGADLSGGYTAGSIYVSNSNLGALNLHARSGTARNNSSFVTTAPGGWAPSGEIDFFLRRSAAQVDVHAGSRGQIVRLGTRATGSSGVGVMGVSTAGVLDVVVLRAAKLTALPVVPA